MTQQMPLMPMTQDEFLGKSRDLANQLAALDEMDAEEKGRREDFKASRRDVLKTIRLFTREIQEQGTRE